MSKADRVVKLTPMDIPGYAVEPEKLKDAKVRHAVSTALGMWEAAENRFEKEKRGRVAAQKEVRRLKDLLDEPASAQPVGVDTDEG